MWQPRLELPAILTTEALSQEIELLSASLAPVSSNEFASIIAKLIAFASTLGIACADPEATRKTYHHTLADLPADLISRAVKRITDKWTYGNRLPVPGEIRAIAKADLAFRAGLLRRAKFAILKN